MKKETEKNPTITNIIERIEEYLKQEFSRNLLLKLEPQILKIQNAELSLWFVENVPNSKISDHQAIVMQYGSFADQKDFASYVPGADISLIGKNIAEKYKDSDTDYIYDFLNDVDVDVKEAIHYMVEVWNKLNEEQRQTLYIKYVGGVYDTIFKQNLAVIKENKALQQVDEISALIRTYQNQSKKA